MTFPRPAVRLTGVKFLTRQEWGAAFDTSGLSTMILPARELWIHHSVTRPTVDPAEDMRGIERIDIQRFGQPSYSYVIHPNGWVMEGCGTHIGAHTYRRNSTSFGVCFIGDFRYDQPTAAALDACAWLVRDLISRGLLSDVTMNPTTGYGGVNPTGGHRDVYATVCPGDYLYNSIPFIRNLVAQGDDDMAADPQIIALLTDIKNGINICVEALAGTETAPRSIRNTINDVADGNQSFKTRTT